MEPQIVLLHGFTHTGASWDPVRAALPERYRALAPDIRGHGSASGTRPVTLGAVLGDLAEQAPDSFILVGYSMGGRIALHAALQLKTRIRGLVVVGASPGIADPIERAERRGADERLAGQIAGASIEAVARRWAGTPILAGQPEHVVAAAHADRLRSTPAGLASALRGLGAAVLPSLWGRLEELGIPVTLVVGERDQRFREVAGIMSAELARAQVVVVPDSGHAAHLEQPDRVAKIIAAHADRWLKVSHDGPMTAP